MGIAARLTAYASNHGPVPMMLPRIEAYGPRALRVALSSLSLELRRLSRSSTSFSAGLIWAWLSVATPRSWIASSRALTSSRWMACLAPLDLLEDQAAVLHQVDEVRAAVGQQRADVTRAPEQVLDLRVARGHRLREPRDPLEAGLDLGGGLVDRVGDDVQRLVELVGVDLLGGLGEVTEDADDVVRRRGPVDRDRRVLVELAGTGGDQVEVLLPEQVEHLDAGLAVLAELDAVVDLEGDQHLAVVELDVLDPAGPDAADLDHVAAVQPARVGEVGLVAVAAEPGELVEVERRGHHQEHHDERDRAQAEQLCLGVAPHWSPPPSRGSRRRRCSGARSSGSSGCRGRRAPAAGRGWCRGCRAA